MALEIGRGPRIAKEKVRWRWSPLRTLSPGYLLGDDRMPILWVHRGSLLFCSARPDDGIPPSEASFCRAPEAKKTSGENSRFRTPQA